MKGWPLLTTMQLARPLHLPARFLKILCGLLSLDVTASGKPPPAPTSAGPCAHNPRSRSALQTSSLCSRMGVFLSLIDCLPSPRLDGVEVWGGGDGKCHCLVPHSIPSTRTGAPRDICGVVETGKEPISGDRRNTV